ncbi:transcriptional regulator Spx [Lactiplantibacillus pentosus]|uniref:Spx/MgsR family RNA polymerase-binding regulatory protein n=1 Tax=Lactiplantibacillus pentosus TaxID=1589 RepID=A0ABD7IT16_LACPE|nr:transcriptional regulator Spx [Lactiplantibacillus pentosus]MCA1344080.1 transcriptional regulator Spx [Lactiplantibacillus pentosus]MCJ8185992.1 transcriptional regulator Spx [Lactiplantibacillus pentosus]MCT3303989.1 Spx/MgsR family RNA polymerase-binding regulatory protein [Lactiplantibacillus pentosus]PRO77971.1 transcriptional regulator [Lactiplantibacillus pentosus]PRO82089.1 transcriptional regulator [Lactiplantibacillus pentosus]
MTVKLYIASSNRSSRNARAWFQRHHIPFTERNIIAQPLQSNEIKRLLRMTENGTEDLISTRAKIFSKLKLDLETISTSELITLIVQHPDLLKRPIMFDEKRLQIGYNEEDIRRFLRVSVNRC